MWWKHDGDIYLHKFLCSDNHNMQCKLYSDSTGNGCADMSNKHNSRVMSNTNSNQQRIQ